MKLRLMLKIGSYRILCPERYDLEQIIKFASKLKLIKEQGYFSTPTKFVPSEGEEIKFELIPEDSIEESKPVKIKVIGDTFDFPNNKVGDIVDATLTALQ